MFNLCKHLVRSPFGQVRVKSWGVEDALPVRWRWGVGGAALFLRMLRGMLGSGCFLFPRGTTSPGAPPRLLFASSATCRANKLPPPPRFRSRMSCILSAAAAATAWEGRGRVVGTRVSLAAAAEAEGLLVGKGIRIIPLTGAGMGTPGLSPRDFLRAGATVS